MHWVQLWEMWVRIAGPGQHVNLGSAYEPAVLHSWLKCSVSHEQYRRQRLEFDIYKWSVPKDWVIYSAALGDKTRGLLNSQDEGTMIIKKVRNYLPSSNVQHLKSLEFSTLEQFTASLILSVVYIYLTWNWLILLQIFNQDKSRGVNDGKLCFENSKILNFWLII